MLLPDALFLDIDGTILKSDHSLSPRVIRAVAAFGEVGTPVYLASGRSWEALKPIYNRLGLDGPSVCYNGAVVVSGPDGKSVFEIPMSEDLARAAITESRVRGLEILAFRRSHLIYGKVGPFIEQYRQRTTLHGSTVNFDDLNPLDFTKVIIISEHENLLPVKESLEKRFESESITFSDPQFLEMMGAGADKGRGLREVCRIRGINPRRTTAMGDGWNDFGMLESAGDAWVMDGAPANLKAHFPPHRVAPHVDIDGAAVVMEAMLAGKKAYLPAWGDAGEAAP